MSSACGSGASITDIERISLEHKQAAAASRAEAPAHLANCVGAGCWDTQGNRYNSGADPLIFAKTVVRVTTLVVDR